MNEEEYLDSKLIQLIKSDDYNNLKLAMIIAGKDKVNYLIIELIDYEINREDIDKNLFKIGCMEFLHYYGSEFISVHSAIHNPIHNKLKKRAIHSHINDLHEFIDLILTYYEDK